MSVRRVAIFIAINAVVSAIVVLLVLSVWDTNRSAIPPMPTSVPRPIVQSSPQPIAPTATPIAPRTYIVQAGDTPIRIATDLGVSVDDLLSANHLRAGDILNIGQELIIPAVGSTSNATATTPPVVTTPRSNATLTLAATLPGGILVTIRQIDGIGDLANESVVLTNLGGDVNLSGWVLSDGESHKYTFPDLSLRSGGEVHVHTTTGTDGAFDLYWGQSTARWSGSGTIAYLRDPTGKLIATYRVP